MICASYVHRKIQGATQEFRWIFKLCVVTWSEKCWEPLTDLKVFAMRIFQIPNMKNTCIQRGKSTCMKKARLWQLPEQRPTTTTNPYPSFRHSSNDLPHQQSIQLKGKVSMATNIIINKTGRRKKELLKRLDEKQWNRWTRPSLKIARSRKFSNFRDSWNIFKRKTRLTRQLPLT